MNPDSISTTVAPPALALSAVRYTQAKPAEAVVRAAGLVGFDASVLEVGPATGNLTRIITSEQRCTVTAIEIDAQAAERVQPLCKAVYVGDFELMDLVTILGEQRFDAVTFGDVLEHMRSPVAALKKVKPYLSDRGTVVISVPNIAHASIAYEIAHGRFDYRSIGLLDETHIRFFTRKTLLKTIDDAGYMVVDLQRVCVQPEDTEFNTRPYTTEQNRLMEFFKSANIESSTYQFVVRIAPQINEQLHVNEAVVCEMQQQMGELKDQLDAQRSRNSKLEHDLKWMEGRWPIRWSQRLKRLLTSR